MDADQIKPGVYELPAREYHRLPAISKSQLDRIARSPMHYRHWMDTPSEQTRQMVLGSALHTAVLEPHLFNSQYFVEPSNAPQDLRRFRSAKKPSAETLEAIAWWDKFAETTTGLTMLTADEMAQIAGMSGAISAHEMASAALVGQRELSVIANEPETGALCKVRPDCWNAPLNLIADLKTCADASPRAFARSCANYRYHVQAALYLAICQAAGLDAESFCFVAVESVAPYAVMVYDLDVPSLVAGMTQAQRDIKRLIECRAANHWPAYSTKPITLTLPEWSLSA